VNAEQEFFWLIGILEGEGCFAANGHTVAAIVDMTDEDTMKKVSKLMGAKLKCRQPSGNRRRVYSASIYGNKAIDLMKRVRPYMSKRRGVKIDHIIKWAKARPGLSPLKPIDIMAIRADFLSGKTQAETSKKYNVSQATISRIVSRKRWKNV